MSTTLLREFPSSRRGRMTWYLAACSTLVAFSLFADRTVSAEGLFTPQHVSRLRTVASGGDLAGWQSHRLHVDRPARSAERREWDRVGRVTRGDRNGRSRPFVTGKVAVSGVQWTPDGRHLAFLTKRADDATPRCTPLRSMAGKRSGVCSTHGHPAGRVQPGRSPVGFPGPRTAVQGAADLSREGLQPADLRGGLAAGQGLDRGGGWFRQPACFAFGRICVRCFMESRRAAVGGCPCASAAGR
jgi:hypothetical protein